MNAVILAKDGVWYVLDNDDLTECNVIGVYRNEYEALAKLVEELKK